MTGQGIGQILVYAVVLIALGYPLGIYMARVYTTRDAAGALLARSSAASSARSAATATGSRTGRATARSCSSSASLFSLFLYGILRLQGHLFLNPDHLPGRAVAHRAEHDRELRHEHELAVLRRRVHDVVPDPDGRARGAELRLRRGRDGRARGGRARNRAPLAGRDRQLLARPLPLARLHPAAARDRPRRDPHLAGRAADLPRPCDRDDAPGRAPDDRARPGRARRSRSSSSARTAAASTTRTRPSRSRTRTGSRTSSRCSRSCSSRRGRCSCSGRWSLRATARLDGVRGDVRRLRDRRRHQPARPSSTARRCCATRA